MNIVDIEETKSIEKEQLNFQFILFEIPLNPYRFNSVWFISFCTSDPVRPSNVAQSIISIININSFLSSFNNRIQNNLSNEFDATNDGQ